jgi:CRISPR-associated protein Cas2
VHRKKEKTSYTTSVIDGFRQMWLIVMFDLPTDTKEARKSYRRFRNTLLDDGFMMLQYSIYGRHTISDEQCSKHSRRVQVNLPPDGQVRMIRITDAQFQRMEVFHGKIRGKTEKNPSQLTFF